MRRHAAFRILLATLLIAGLILPSTALAGTTSTRGKYVNTLGAEPGWGDYGDAFRCDHAWKATAATSKKPAGGIFTLKQYLVADDGAAVKPSLLGSWSWAVTDVMRIDETTVQFHAPGSFGFGSEAEYYATGVWRATDSGKSDSLSYLCSACDVYHAMGGERLKVHSK